MNWRNLLLLAALVMINSCESNNSNGEELSNIKEELKRYKDEYNDLTGFINVVDDDLSRIVKAQGELDDSILDGGEIGGTQMDKITSNIQKLERALNDANQKVAGIEDKLRRARNENASLRKSLKSYKKQLADKKQEIEEYKTKIKNLQDEIDSGKKTIETQKKELELKNKALESKKKELEAKNKELADKNKELDGKNNRIVELSLGYYDYGTAKELQGRGILEDKRIKSDETKQELEGDFHRKVKKSNKIDTGSASEIAHPGITTEIKRILPFRDPSSYSIEGTKIKILNKSKFWDRTKVAILIVEKS